MRTQLLNNSEGPIYAQLPHRGADKAGVIQHGGVVIINPGLNFVDKETVDTLRKNPGFDKLFTERLKPSKAPERNVANFGKPHLEIAGKDIADEYPLLKQNIAACEGIICQVQAGEVLVEWLKLEVRPEVRKLIDERMTFLTGSPVTKGTVSAG